MPRLFFALWPDSDTREQLWQAAQSLDVRDGRRIRAENLHLTLHFLGEVEVSLARRVCDELRSPAVQAFELEIGRAGWWRTSRVAWLAPLATPDEMSELVERLSRELARLGLKMNTCSYSPHITVARQVRRGPRAHGAVRLTWKVTDFVLVKSRTDAAGATYEPLKTWDLKAL